MLTTAHLILALATWSNLVNAAPSTRKAARALAKRAAPQIGEGFSDVEVQQITDAFNDAMELASYTQTSSRQATDPIFAKYFNTGDRQLVDDVFRSILGGDPAAPPGNAFLSNVRVVPDFPNPSGELTCDGQNMAATRGFTTGNPTIIICPEAGFGHGGIGKGYDGVEEVVCDNFDPQLSWKLETLGSIVLHEYTHINGLVVPPLQKSTDDVSEDTYGPYGSRNIDKAQATNNADNYVWYANEVLWTILCNKDFTDPAIEDGDDPNCDDMVCSDDSEA